MEIRLHGRGEAPRPVAVTMRTPGNDFELAVGFCVSEGLLGGGERVEQVEYCVGPNGTQEFNVVTIRRQSLVGDSLRSRPYSATASCGVCGKETLADLAVRCNLVASKTTFSWVTVSRLPSRVTTDQKLFDATGGIHSASLFDSCGEILLTREDVGRHNALDKLIGSEFLARRLPLDDRGVFLSGRIGFELVQKAAVAGIGLIVAFGAPTSLAIETANQFGICLVGFLKADRANVYTHRERVTT